MHIRRKNALITELEMEKSMIDTQLVQKLIRPSDVLFDPL